MSNSSNQVWNLIEEKEKLDNNQNFLKEVWENKEKYKEMTFEVLEWEKLEENDIYSKFWEVKSKEEFVKLYNTIEKWSLDFWIFVEKFWENMEKVFSSEKGLFKYIDIFKITSILNFENNTFMFSEEDWKNILNFFWNSWTLTMETFIFFSKLETNKFFIEMKDFSNEELEEKYPLLFKKNINIIIKKYNISFKELENKKEISELNIYQ